MNGSPLQNLPSQHAQPNGSVRPQSTITNGNAGSSTNQSSPPKRPALLQILSSFVRTVRSFPRPLWNSIKYWVRPLVCLATVSLTLYTVWSARNQHTLLGRVSPSLGTWILNIFAKAGDICFAFAVEDMFDTIAWRKLGERNRKYGRIELERFLSVTSSTGIEGLGRLLWRRFRKWVVRHFVRFWGSRQPARSSETANASKEQKWRTWWKNGRVSRWAFARLLFVVALIPGPGIILMANIDQTTIFFDAGSMNVSAGIATFDPTIANASGAVVAPLVSRYIQVLLQDRSFSWSVAAVDPACNTARNCTSYLIAGPYLTVTPWPFGSPKESVELTSFRIRNAPFYQVDMWDSTIETLGFSESKDCAIYGGLDAVHEYSTLMCVAQQDTKGTLAAGWASCQLGYSTINGSCLAPGGRDDWGTFFRFYRRNATITFSRSDFEILDVDDMSDPQLQNITPAALFTALDAILYRPERADETLKFYDIRSAEYILTQTIGVKLWSSLQNNTAGLKIGRNWLRNLVTLPVYVFQPTYIELAPNLLPLPTDNGTEPQPNLPAENYVVGSYCTENKRSIPGRGTVYAYTAVAGLLLALVIIAKTRALRWNDMATSDFAVLDYHVLTKVVDGKGDEVSLREELGIAGRDYGTSALLDRIPDLRVGLR